MIPAIVFSGVALAYGPVPVIEDLSLALAAGQTHCLIGPSGSGKSTILRSITGLSAPIRGEVKVLGRRVEHADAASQREANRGAGLVLQNGGLFPHLSVRDNVVLPAVLAGWSRERIEQRLMELEALVGLASELRARYPRALSGGQRQRVALARALFLDPPLLLLDEPLSSLDPQSRTELQEEMKRLFGSLARTVVLVTHDVPEALFLADTITLLDRGRVAQHGPAETIARHPASDWARTFVRSAAPRWRHMLGLVDGESP
ncbi:MAG TPA: ATP-binding cassette domain-containing protein [Myxococcota bacterium]|nr:ATP-binding cassette domain-containing protein [Myxococcota bacterium]